MKLEIREITTDFLILGGGTAGCFAAISFAEHGSGKALIAEKAAIVRSGCLAAGVNALNAYIGQGKTPQDYVDYAMADAEMIARPDLLLSMAEGVNRAAEKLEGLGLTILKDEMGSYAERGWRNIKINGENIKPLLAAAVRAKPEISVLERACAFEYIIEGGRVAGAYAVSVEEPVLYAIKAKAVLCATGGAAGLYRPNNPGFSRHKMWYPPFNTGAGYAMGILAGAEMTSFEMRFIALRCKGTIAPTGTLAQGVGARQINAAGEAYEARYGLSTSQRVYGTVKENAEGRGPCYLKTAGITTREAEELKRAYLNMAPSQTLKWVESGRGPEEENVEIEGTEPYIVGGHTASGYWVSQNRETTLPGLYAAGDVAGGCPQKYVTGALVEGEIAAKAAAEYIQSIPKIAPAQAGAAEERKAWLEGFLTGPQGRGSIDGLEEEMQSAMDRYAGGISSDYACDEASLELADQKIAEIASRLPALHAEDMQELVYILELRERLVVCRSLIAHMRSRKETRWHAFCERADYPDKSPEYEAYINSCMVDGKIEIITRELVRL